MPRPTTQEQLLSAARQEFAALEKLLTPLSAEQMTRPGAIGDWSAKDTLAHLAEWMKMFFVWHETGLRGETPALPAPGFKWNQLPALNRQIYLQYRDLALDEVWALLRAQHQRTLELIENLSHEQLFISGSFAWSGKHSLATFLNANTASHYRWARTELRKGLTSR